MLQVDKTWGLNEICSMQTLAFIQNLGTGELIIIFLVILIFFGAKRLPGLFGSFGKALKEFKKATRDIEDDIQTAMNPEPPRRVQPPATSVNREQPLEMEPESVSDPKQSVTAEKSEEPTTSGNS